MYDSGCTDVCTSCLLIACMGHFLHPVICVEAESFLTLIQGRKVFNAPMESFCDFENAVECRLEIQ